MSSWSRESTKPTSANRAWDSSIRRRYVEADRDKQKHPRAWRDLLRHMCENMRKKDYRQLPRRNLLRDCNLSEAIFKGMSAHSTPAVEDINTMIRIFARVGGCLDKCYRYFGMIRELDMTPSIDSFHQLIIALRNEGHPHKSFGFLAEMKAAGIQPTIVTFNLLLGAICREMNPVTRNRKDIKFFVKEGANIKSPYPAVHVPGEAKAHNTQNNRPTVRVPYNPANDWVSQVLHSIPPAERNSFARKLATFEEFEYEEESSSSSRSSAASAIHNANTEPSTTPGTTTTHPTTVSTDTSTATDTSVAADATIATTTASTATATTATCIDDTSEPARLLRDMESESDWQEHSVKTDETDTMRDADQADLGRKVPIAALSDAFHLLDQMFRVGCTPNIYSFNIILEMCARFGDAHATKRVFCLLHENQDTHVHNLIPSFYVSMLPQDAFHAQVHTNTPTHTYAPAFQVFQVMVDSGVRPHVATLSLLIKACGNDAVEARRRWTKLTQEYGVQPDAACYNQLIRVVSGSGDVECTEKHIASMQAAGISPDLATFSCLILSHAHSNDGRSIPEAEILHRIEKVGLKPDSHIFNCLISAHARAGDMDSALQVLRRREAAGLKPGPDSLYPLIKGFLFIGDIDAALDVYDKMKHVANLRCYDLLTQALRANEHTHKQALVRVLQDKYFLKTKQRSLKAKSKAAAAGRGMVARIDSEKAVTSYLDVPAQHVGALLGPVRCSLLSL